MPKVSGKSFPYNAKGKADAKKEAAKEETMPQFFERRSKKAKK